MRMSFGCHKDQSISDLPDDYLRWLCRIAREPLLCEVHSEIQRRRKTALTVLDHALARQIIDNGFRQLAVKLHPDHGGTTTGMQLLNASADFLRKKLLEAR